MGPPSESAAGWSIGTAYNTSFGAAVSFGAAMPYIGFDTLRSIGTAYNTSFAAAMPYIGFAMLSTTAIELGSRPGFDAIGFIIISMVPPPASSNGPSFGILPERYCLATNNPSRAITAKVPKRPVATEAVEPKANTSTVVVVVVVEDTVVVVVLAVVVVVVVVVVPVVVVVVTVVVVVVVPVVVVEVTVVVVVVTVVVVVVDVAVVLVPVMVVRVVVVVASWQFLPIQPKPQVHA